jgi:hypothetical protein
MERELVSLEQLVSESFRKGDKATLAGLLTNDFTYTLRRNNAASGGNQKEVWDKTTFLAKAKRGATGIKYQMCEGYKLKLEDNIVVITGRCMKAINGGQIGGSHTFNDLWVKIGGNWKILDSEVDLPAGENLEN